MLQHLPPALINSLQSAPGFNEQEFVRTHESGEQVVSVRTNPAKVNTAAAVADLGERLKTSSRVPWSSTGFYLKTRPSFTLDPTFHAGAYYVQEASSMFLEQVLTQACALAEPLKILDLCAAPGGKSTLIASIMSADSLLVSNELIKTRANILAENITKWGIANVVVTNNDSRDFQKLTGFFDVIVVDAPCSGSGLFRKDPGAINEWSLNSIDLCSQRQKKILSDILPSLKQDGILIYSTCSYSEKEDEEICDWLLSDPESSLESIQIQNEPEWGIVETLSDASKCFGYRFYPDRLRGEGFFIAAFRKNSTEKVFTDNSRKAKPIMASKAELLVLKNYIIEASNYAFLKFKNELLVIPQSTFPALLQLRELLYIRKAGVNAGTLIRDELVPDHELVLSNLMCPIFPLLEVDEGTALNYLRRKDFEIQTMLSGWAVTSYLGFALGLVKILPSRINNYYPREWRIINK